LRSPLPDLPLNKLQSETAKQRQTTPRYSGRDVDTAVALCSSKGFWFSVIFYLRFEIFLSSLIPLSLTSLPFLRNIIFSLISSMSTSQTPSYIPSSEYSSFGQFSMNYLQSNDQSYHKYHSYNIFIGSWNVNAKIEDISNLSSKFLNIDSFIGDSPDLIILGFQEIIELSATNTLVASAAVNTPTPSNISAERINKWSEIILESLRNGPFMRQRDTTTSSSSSSFSSTPPSSSSSYHLVESLSMVGIWCVIYSKKYLLSLISNIQSKTIPRGARGVLGNKGSVCISLTLHETKICFICAHLTANREEILKRNEDYSFIMKKKIFLTSSTSSSSLSSCPPSTSSSSLSSSTYSLGFMSQLQSETAMSTSQTKVFNSILEKKEQLLNCLQDLQMNFTGASATSASAAASADSQDGISGYPSLLSLTLLLTLPNSAPNPFHLSFSLLPPSIHPSSHDLTIHIPSSFPSPPSSPPSLFPSSLCLFRMSSRNHH
jgi:hypothetical protein